MAWLWVILTFLFLVPFLHLLRWFLMLIFRILMTCLVVTSPSLNLVKWMRKVMTTLFFLLQLHIVICLWMTPALFLMPRLHNQMCLWLLWTAPSMSLMLLLHIAICLSMVWMTPALFLFSRLHIL
jgi:hypothetical protein